MTAPQPPREMTERRDAARALLRSPFLIDGDTLPLVRRHAAALKTTFATWLGYTLYVEPAFARLIKAPLTADAPTRPARRTSGGEFTPRTYVYLTLLSASLLAPQTGEQILVSALVGQVRADAATAQVTLDDSYADQRHLLAAFRQLIAWGVLEETAGSVAEWSERREAEALLTIHRQMLPHLLARPLTYDDPAALLTADPDVVEQPRRSLRRKLVENPLVRREDLTDAERDVLSRERTELTRVLDETFGLMLEVRAEGALAYDPDREVTDLEFPGASTVRQAALLTVDELLARHTPKAGATADIAGRAVPGVLCPWPQVGEVVTELSTLHSKAWGAEYVTDPARLQAEVVATLTAFGLATGTDGGLVLHPAAARHRPTVSETPARTRAQTRLTGDPDQGSLFDPETQ